MKKEDYESDLSQSPSFCSNSECCCGCGDTDCSKCEEESDESRNSTPHPQDRTKRDSSSKKEARSPTNKGSSNDFSTMKNQKTKKSSNSSTESFKGNSATKWIEGNKKYSFPTKEIERNKQSSLSTKVEKQSKRKFLIEKKKVDKKSKASSKEVENEKLMPHLLALDKKVAKTLSHSSELEYESNGSDLESDYFIEKKTSKNNQKKVVKGKKEAEKKKSTHRGEGKELVRFTKEEDEEIISFIEKNVDMPQLNRHMKDVFPNRRRASSSIHGRREVLFKKWKEAALNGHHSKN